MKRYEITLTPSGRLSKVIEDSVDISRDLHGIEVRSFVGEVTTVVLHKMGEVSGTVDVEDAA